MIEIKAKRKLVSCTGEMILDVEFEMERHTFVAVTGVSGSGKTTLLRCVAGLTRPDSGYIAFDGEVWFDPGRKISVPARKRSVGFVFQDYALFPNMTFRENILYACGNTELADGLIAMAGLEGIAGLKPDKLSGGQKQRCALLRAVSRRPQLLLLDEPFSALDPGTRKQFHDELVRWADVFGLTVIMVSHDRAGVVRLAHRVIQLDAGAIESDVSHRCGCPGRNVPYMNTERRVS